MPKRELSCFLCRELLYEYVAHSIDSRRGDAVALHLKECEDCKKEQQGLEGAVGYTRKLVAVEIRPEYLESISKPIPMNKLVAHRLGWKNWPDPLRWTVESLAFASLVAVVVAVLGQEFFQKPTRSQQVPIAESNSETVNIAHLPDQTPAEFGEEEFTDHENDVEVGHAHAKPEASGSRTPSPEPDVSVVQAEQEVVATNTSSSPQTPTQTKTALAEDTENTTSRSQNGFLYRSLFSVADIDTATQELLAKVEALGGKKAGGVPLGWRRPTGSYFHFSMPESNFAELSQFLKKFPGSAVAKEKNPRVMPEGTIRMIIEVNVPSGASTPQPQEATPNPAPVPGPSPESAPTPEEPANNGQE